MSVMASQITSLAIVCSAIYSGTDQRIHQSSASLAFVREIHRSSVNSPHKGPVMRKLFPFDYIIMNNKNNNPQVIFKMIGIYCIHLGNNIDKYNSMH